MWRGQIWPNSDTVSKLYIYFSENIRLKQLLMLKFLDNFNFWTASFFRIGSIFLSTQHLLKLIRNHLNLVIFWQKSSNFVYPILILHNRIHAKCSLFVTCSHPILPFYGEQERYLFFPDLVYLLGKENRKTLRCLKWFWWLVIMVLWVIKFLRKGYKSDRFLSLNSIF